MAHLVQCVLPGIVREATYEQMDELRGLQHIGALASRVQQALGVLYLNLCGTLFSATYEAMGGVQHIVRQKPDEEDARYIQRSGSKRSNTREWVFMRVIDILRMLCEEIG